MPTTSWSSQVKRKEKENTANLTFRGTDQEKEKRSGRMGGEKKVGRGGYPRLPSKRGITERKDLLILQSVSRKFPKILWQAEGKVGGEPRPYDQPGWGV